MLSLARGPALALVVSLAIGALFAQRAEAQNPERIVRVGILGGGSAKTRDDGVGYRWSGGAVGGEVGITFALPFYLGAHALEVIGESVALPGGARRASSQHFLVDLGYDIRAHGIFVRPSLSFGIERLFTVVGEDEGERASHALSGLLLGGFGFVWDFGTHGYVGADGRGGYAIRPVGVSSRLTPEKDRSMNPLVEVVARVGMRF